MYRVVTKFRNGTSRPVVERGPWHTSREVAEYWVEQMRAHGYVAYIESQNGVTDAGMGKSDNADLAAALASMA